MSIFKDHIDAMTAYTPPLEGRDPVAYTLLDFNERTIEVVEPIRQALHAFIDGGRLHMYPSYGDIVEKIAAYAGVEAGQVMITNGSDHGIDLIIRSACQAGDEIIIPGPSFAMYGQCARFEGLSIVEPQYTREGGYPVAEVIAAVTEKTRVVVVSNPNNPCGTLVAPDEIVRIAKAAPGAAILVDECYFEYSKVTVADRLLECPNIVITRTFSKTWGLPSVRLGYVLSVADNINALLNVRGPYDINQFAVVAVSTGLDAPDVSLAYVDEVMTVSKPMLESFLDEVGIAYWPSAANYLWTFPEEPQALELALREARILVRPKADGANRLGLRITIGTVEQTRRVIEVLRQALA
ncbi:histidinol-phosphate aminotransferase family protein [Aestuariicella hydrocarbonica]|uniref:histidinol-phosphate transaminase n=1 Tax=Pseudomaricurvus hydrocarbonicus TaxID=1470433 RepID=A0A9E5MLX9_9GAMM|nr:histidinol-phosphate transaminase [Aestuariicella hydrocarbonica]NHO64940.1 histidinol-phosphate aminotransferase family protein [Aestuariicella hydrocarbonica]